MVCLLNSDKTKQKEFNSNVFFFHFLDKAKEEINNLIHKNKSKWELEIEQSFERLKKVS